MSDFGASIISRASDRRGEYVDRMFRQAQAYEQSRQFDVAAKSGKDLSMAERDLQMIQRAQAGDQSPEVKAYINARKAMEAGKTTYTVDPYNNVRAVPAPNPFDMLSESAGSYTGGQNKPTLMMGKHRAGEIGQPIDDGTSLPGAGAKPDDILAMLGVGGDPSGPPSDTTFDRLMMPVPPTDGRPDPMRPLSEEQYAHMAMTGQMPGEEGPDVPTLPPASDVYTNSPKGDIARGDARVAVEQAGSMLGVKSAEADIDASKAGAAAFNTKTGEQKAAIGAKLEPINNILGELEALDLSVLRNAPNGQLQGYGAAATNFLGTPSKAALAAAELDQKIPYFMSQIKNIVRNAGEGTFTKDDQAMIEPMSYQSSDPTEIKIQKYNQLKGMMQRARDRIAGDVQEYKASHGGKPGFKYLGVKK